MEQKRFVKSIAGEVVSSLEFYAVQLPTRHLGVIEEVQTAQEYREKGYATELILEAIAYAKSIGCTCVELTVREDKPKIQAFYQGFGFVDRLNRAYRLKL
jgi:ribosomal protein S18 acetylase RimI-like enzyme